jgi:hypothetical protein
MPIDKAAVVRLIRASSEKEERTQLLRLAGTKPGLWEALEEEDVVDVLRAELQKETLGNKTLLQGLQKLH